MKLLDRLAIVEQENKKEWKEVVAGTILQILILSCLFFVFSLATNIFSLADSYLKKTYTEGYVFELHGYAKEEKGHLQQMGFENMEEDEDSNLFQGKLNSMRYIIPIKADALLHGKDVWNADLDEYIIAFAIFQIILIVIAIGLVLILINNLCNSLSIKLIRRQKFVEMLFLLGESRKGVQKIFNSFFGIRTLFSSLCALLVYINACNLFNQYICDKFGMIIGIDIIPLWGFAALGIAFVILLNHSFKKVWKEKYETT